MVPPPVPQPPGQAATAYVHVVHIRCCITRNRSDAFVHTFTSHGLSPFDTCTCTHSEVRWVLNFTACGRQAGSTGAVAWFCIHCVKLLLLETVFREDET